MPYVLGMKKTKAMLLTGDRITATEAERIGLITSVVSDDKLDEEVMTLAKKLVKIPVPAMRLNKEAINRSYEMAGFTSAIHSGEDIFATVLMSETPEAARFFEIANKDGLAAAFKWRDAFFADQDAE
jgi:enoyl-CoA hydratase/carnithine racemase